MREEDLLAWHGPLAVLVAEAGVLVVQAKI